MIIEINTTLESWHNMTPLERASNILDYITELYDKDLTRETREKLVALEREAIQLVLDLDDDK